MFNGIKSRTGLSFIYIKIILRYFNILERIYINNISKLLITFFILKFHIFASIYLSIPTHFPPLLNSITRNYLLFRKK